MHHDHPTIHLTPSLHRQFVRLKQQGHFQSDQDWMQALLEAWESQRPKSSGNAAFYGNKRYMSRPGLSIEDYDT